MRGAKVRTGVLLVAPLVYGVIAFWVQAAADRNFDVRMLRDRTELAASLERHGASAAQVADLMAYEAAVSRDVSGIGQTTSSACIGTLMFLGVTLGGLVALGRRGEAE